MISLVATDGLGRAGCKRPREENEQRHTSNKGELGSAKDGVYMKIRKIKSLRQHVSVALEAAVFGHGVMRC